MKALVTGATGLVGSHLVDLLVASGERPRVLVQPADTAGDLARNMVSAFDQVNHEHVVADSAAAIGS